MRIRLLSIFQLIAVWLFMKPKLISITIACLLAFAFAGCMKARPVQVPPPAEEQVEPERPPEPALLEAVMQVREMRRS